MHLSRLGLLGATPCGVHPFLLFGVCWSLWNRSRPDGLGATRRTGVRRDLLDGVLPISRPFTSSG